MFSKLSSFALIAIVCAVTMTAATPANHDEQPTHPPPGGPGPKEPPASANQTLVDLCAEKNYGGCKTYTGKTEHCYPISTGTVNTTHATNATNATISSLKLGPGIEFCFLFPKAECDGEPLGFNQSEPTLSLQNMTFTSFGCVAGNATANDTAKAA